MHGLVAGATGYLGRHLCAEHARRGHHVAALVRGVARARGPADIPVEAEATRPETLDGVMDGMDLVVSALGITRQADGLVYRDVDHRATLTFLREAEAAGVARLAYVHVPHAERIAGVPLVVAETDFVTALRVSAIPATVIAPTGYVSDLGDIFEGARRGRVCPFGTGSGRLDPIHGADLAERIADATDIGIAHAEIGGPDVLTQDEIARASFSALGTEPSVTHLPDRLRRAALAALPVLPRRIGGAARFFLTALGMDMVAPRHGSRRLSDHFTDLAAEAAAVTRGAAS